MDGRVLGRAPVFARRLILDNAAPAAMVPGTAHRAAFGRVPDPAIIFRRNADRAGRSTMRIDIDQLTEAELVDLNHRVVERLRFLHQMRSHKRMLDFRIGRSGVVPVAGRRNGNRRAHA
ncbi:MAG TPA: hypothetical protein VGG01_15110 [Xanthobacteraceae bacterium]|jgi:hypothetical protein